tara:strand:- start:3789 stop:4613 length:825 start_codon:yes stop_codon:yes gene_type:complete
MATDATKKLQELIEDVRGSGSTLTVSGAEKIDAATKQKLGLFQAGLASIKDQDPSVEARRKAAFSIGNLGANFALKKMFGGEDSLNDRKGFKKQRQAYQELKTEYLSSKFKDPETAELLRELAPKFEKESAIRTAQNDYNKIISIGNFGTTDPDGKPIPLDKQIQALQLRVEDDRISTNDMALFSNELERRNMLLQDEVYKTNELRDEQAFESGRDLTADTYNPMQESIANEPYDLKTGELKNRQLSPAEQSASNRAGLFNILTKKKDEISFGE